MSNSEKTLHGQLVINDKKFVYDSSFCNSAVVEQSPHHPKGKGSSQSPTDGTGAWIIKLITAVIDSVPW